MSDSSIEILEILIFKSKNPNIDSWGYTVKRVDKEAWFTLNKAYVHTIFGNNPEDFLSKIFKINGKVSPNPKNPKFTDLKIVHNFGTYVKA